MIHSVELALREVTNGALGACHFDGKSLEIILGNGARVPLFGPPDDFIVHLNAYVSDLAARTYKTAVETTHAQITS